MPIVNKQDNEVTEQVINIPLSELKPFQNHPFKVREDEAMAETVAALGNTECLYQLLQDHTPKVVMS